MLDPESTVLLDVNHVSQTYSKGSGEPGACSRPSTGGSSRTC